MLHGPHTHSSPCYIKDKSICKKKFPKSFTDYTKFKKNGYPEYRRRNNILENFTYKAKNNNQLIPVDNSMVVPYNSFLLKKYKCHINVEYCASIQSIKYIFDYIHKGGDRALCKLKKVDDRNDDIIYDEITQFVDGRYLSPMEAAWRLQTFALCGRRHTVISLSVHTENQQRIIFEENNETKALQNWKTTLTAWFELNRKDDYAKNIKYVNIPKYYNFENKCWIKRKRNLEHYTIGRLNIVSPKDIERFHLKLILNRVKGATSFQDLRTYENCTYNTYRETAIKMGLVDDDLQIKNIFKEACDVMLGYQLRQFFAWFLLSENINGNNIWNEFKNFFIEDFKDDKVNNALIQINEILTLNEKSCTDFGLPEPNKTLKTECNDINETNILYCKEMFTNMYTQLNSEQKYIFEKLLNSESKIHFIDGPGGSGKTFLYKTLIFYFLSKKKKFYQWLGLVLRQYYYQKG